MSGALKELQGIIANVQLDCGNGATLTSLYVSAVHLGAAQAWASSRMCWPVPMPAAIQTVISNHLATAASAYAGFLPCTPGVSLGQFASIPLGSLNSIEPHTHITGLHTNLLWNNALSECRCNCTDKNTHITNTTKCWPGSYAAWNAQTQRTECYCNPGLVWNSTKTACIDPQELVRNANCSIYPGSYAAWNAQTQKVECLCPTGKKWNSTMTACVDATTTTVTNTGCTADEAATFAKMTGAWKGYRMHVIIGGSCGQASGTWKVTEWCEGVDETYNASVARINGTFTGKMQGGSLIVEYQSPPSPNNSKGTKGTGSCYVGSNGTLSCS